MAYVSLERLQKLYIGDNSNFEFLSKFFIHVFFQDLVDNS